MAGGLQRSPAVPTTSLQRLYSVEKVNCTDPVIPRIVHAVELAGSVMEELASSGGPRAETVGNQCREFMQSLKDIQSTLREEIKSSCDYRAYENCDYASRTSAEIKVMKLDYVLSQIQSMEETVDQFHSPATPSQQ